MDASTPAHTSAVQTNITAQTGGTVCAPVLHGNLFQGQVVFNLHGAHEASSANPSTAQTGSSVACAELSEDLIAKQKQEHKSKLQKKFQKINEGLSKQGNITHLNEIYIELYITEGGSGEVNNEHEVRQIEISRRQPTEETPIKCNDIFKPSPEQDKVIRTVLTRGVAGIGKTVSVQKFILDWIDGTANQDVTFIFPLPFRELNLMKGKKLSLIDLLQCLFPETEILTLIDYVENKVIFILDGLDEYRLPLDFQNNESLFDVRESTSVDVLLTNLIKGNLLHPALLWITTRPAAANQIPSECVDRVTEIRGFSDPQKEEYFRKRISDQSNAEKIITHIQSSRSLYIMCYIPVFCWISATVLERVLGETESRQIPKTLTQLFTQFMIFQTKHGSQKYQGTCVIDPHQTRESILALGKLAFQQLQKGNLIFYEEDIRECGINVREMSVHSGMYTQIFREEFELDQVFTFVHLSIQEFLAALYAFLSFILNNENILKQKVTGIHGLFSKSNMTTFLKNAVHQALQSENGHLDLFLRFLLGLSLETNQTLLRGLLPQTATSSHSMNEVIKYIKRKIRENPFPEKSINLFHCLNELNDHSLVQEVQTYLNTRGNGRLNGAKLSSAQWSALVFVLLNSEEELDEFNLRKYNKSDECLLRLLPVVKASRKAELCECNLTEKSCATLASALSSNSNLRKLDLSKNNLKDSGVKLLSASLKSPECKLQILRLESCSFTSEGWTVLVKALKSNPSSYLRELNLNNNKPGESGVKELSYLLEDPRCKLEKLQLYNCSITEEGCVALVTSLKSNPSHLRELNLNWNNISDLGVKELSNLLKDPQCQLEKLLLECCSITEAGCEALVKALESNPSHLRELNLKYNKLGEEGDKKLTDLLEDPHYKLKKLLLCNTLHLQELNLAGNKLGHSGVKQLSDLLEDPRSKLEKLQLTNCDLTEESCATLASVLGSESSILKYLVLSLNQLEDSGVKLLSAGLENPHCKLETLRLFDCNLTEKSCAVLASVLSSNASRLRALILSNNKLQNSGVKLLSAGLENPHCKLVHLDLCECNLTEKSCAVLASALSSKFSSLRSLDLGFNELEDSGMKLLSAALVNPQCKLETLRLCRCSLTEESCAVLAPVLISNSSSLRKLNLSANNLDDSGIKLLSAALEHQNCKLEGLRLAYCFCTKKGCADLVLALKLNPSHVRELNLGHNNITDLGVKLLSVLLEDQHCKLEKLKLWNCKLTEKSCAVLASALSSNFTCLRELDLSSNMLQDSGVKLLSVGLENPYCKLETLRLCKCNLTAESCAVLASALSSNSGLRELDLSKNELQDSGVKLLCAGLENPHCKLEKLELEKSSITDEGCAALASALKLNPSYMRELNLDWNELGESGVKELSDLLEDPHCKLEKLEVFKEKLRCFSQKMESFSPAHSTSIQNIITAQTGGNICAPVIDGTTIQGALTIITNIHGAQEASTFSSSALQDVNSALTEESITAYKQHHKSILEKKYSSFKERLSYHGISTSLNEIYTELYITEGGSGEVNNEHEVRQIETTSRRKTTQERPIKCNDIFKPLPGQDKPIRTVLTRGVAGIGKTVSVQKFILDWAEGKANQDISFIFPLPFRELNLIKERKLSLLQLLHRFFPATKEFPLVNSDAYNILLIFDGLDECQLPLDFQDNEILSDVTESSSVDVLLTNLINENLLPSALLWITSRPAAANQIPPEWVDQVTEVRGFSDPQKEEYFRKRISDQSLAEKIITHVKSTRSLYIMCHIPVFCWISATVLERMLNENKNIPKTLTQMFTCFLNFQIKHKAKKYHKRCDTDLTRENILALGKLAFQQLERGNLIFYEDDLRECGIDVNEASVYSGVCTQIFREEFVLHLEKVFSFVHLSVQEFLAALFAFLSFISDNRNVLLEQATGYFGFGQLVRRSQISGFLNCAVDKALKCENGHLDLFLRFLLGLSLESNQTLLRGLLPQTACDSHSKDETVKYIKEKIRENASPEKSINLFHCLNELNDHSLVQEVQMYLNRRGNSRLSGANLSPAQWSALVFVLLNSEQELDEFDLNKYDKSDECLLRLLPVVKASRKVMLCECNLTEKSCSALAEALSSNSSGLRKLNLSNNKLKDSGVELLSAGLGNPHCKLETLRLQRCWIREEGFAALAKALKSNPSHLRELELNYNYPGYLGVKELAALLEDPHCKLEKLQLSDCNITEEGSVVLLKALKSNPSHLRELNLSDNEVGESAAKELSDLLKDPHCKVEKLELCYCNLTGKNCTPLASALRSNVLNLIELDLSNNELQDSGIKLLSDALKNPHCKLEMLGLEVCSITAEGCVALAKALKSNPSHLKELNLNYNKPGDSGVKELCCLLKDPHCRLEKLQLDICCITEEGCVALTTALKSNPLSHLRELNLNYNKPGDSGVKELFHFLGHPYCKLQKLLLNGCNLTQKSCAALASALNSNSSTLRELDLSNNKLQDSGVELLSTGLENPQCKLEILRLVNCNITEKGCYSLLKALKSNPPHLRQLDLNHNEIEESGMMLLSELLKDPHCYLEKLIEKDCESQASSLKQLRDLNHYYKKTEEIGVKMSPDLLEDLNCKLKKRFCVPSNSRELNLNFKKVRDSGIKLLSSHLEDPHCKVEKLLLRWCSLTGESCAILASVLSMNSLCLRELDLSNNKLQDSGVQLLSVGLENPHCKLAILSMCGCNLTEKCCAILASVLSSASSILSELNLSSNKLQDSGVKLICAGLENPHCKLKTLRLKYCSITEEGCADLFHALKSNSSSQLRELNLSLNKPGESGVKLLSVLVENPHYKLAKLDI
ncbi:uncharacterized protein LOC118822939 [Colossoma macropomum]|uniref:uncharacterized protein LOC118822939 n=1 Tax=Colossoma macropomum TaxID=42526 RepID=UPI001864ACAF|nr:uncharacterized protein LOC118822939 [Colossoma macropomum]